MKDWFSSVIYSEFDEKAGPKAKLIYPKPLNQTLVDSISNISLNFNKNMEKNSSSLTITEIPKEHKKILIKNFYYDNPLWQGGMVMAAITLLLEDEMDIYFYKNMRTFEQLLGAIARGLISFYETPGKSNLITEIQLQEIFQRIQDTIGKLNAKEILPQGNMDLNSNPTNLTLPIPISNMINTIQGFQNINTSKEYKFKMIICGNGGVGKTSLISYFMNHTISPTYIPTIEVEITNKIIKMAQNAITVDLSIWDITGQSKSKFFRQSVYEGAQAAVFICDMINKNSLNNISEWMNDLKTKNYKASCFFIFNKCDCVNKFQIQESDIVNLQKTYNIPVFKTSALTGENVDFAFYSIAASLIL